ncbi:glycosyltransferase family 25 protein [uncultured Litoreibacter sp.]|uniref:glycosyltransferase family 25 protein n=1 Tax=uncultured Litoreibacter sp. TaxID=1392394 RepID=UPI00260DC709|nr:glycosyltransferase family 25 protein [uncultured Litoreibacter sp.]
MIEAFVIHLERATSRRPHVEAMLDRSPYPARLWPACDGAAMDAAQRSALVAKQSLFQPAYPFSLSMGEIGCFESHRSIWKHMVDTDLEVALILEDDVSIDQDTFEAALACAESQIDELGYIQLQVREVRMPFTVVAQSGAQAVIRPQIVPLRTSAQLVSLKAAKSLLACCDQIDRPVDGFLQLFWETGIHPHCVVPSGVSDLTQESGGSTVSRKRSLWQKLIAAAKRWTYRNQIATLSRRRG